MSATRDIFEYEVEVQLTNPNTKERRIVARREHAYSVMDACFQASMAIAAEAGSSELKLLRIGPPRDSIIKAAEALTDSVARAMADVARRAKKGKQS